MDVNEYEQQSNFPLRHKGRHGHDHMVVGFTTHTMIQSHQTQQQ
jgi:hypothetical protein